MFAPFRSNPRVERYHCRLSMFAQICYVTYYSDTKIGITPKNILLILTRKT